MNEDFTKNIDQIESWLRGELEGAEKESFQKRMQEDPDFANQVEGIKDMMSSIELAGKNRIREKAKSIEAKLEAEDFFKKEEKQNAKETVDQDSKVVPIKAAKNRSIGRLFAIAASIALLLAVGAYLFQQGNGDMDRFAKFYQPESKEVVKIIDRLEARGFSSTDKAAKDSLANALKLYQGQQYKKAQSSLSVYLEAHPENQIAQLYMGLSLFQFPEFNKASNHLKPLAEDANFQFQNMAKWHLGLCYARLDTKDGISNAKKVFENLAADSNSGYQEKANDILQKMTQ